MSKWISLGAAAALLFTGCNKSPEGGTPGTSSSFKLSGPTMGTTIKQNNKESLKITLERGKDFKHTVKLSVAVSPPEKVKAELNKDSFAPSDSGDATVTITVDKDAALGDRTVKVTGTPDGGTATSVDVKITIAANP